MSLGDTLTIVNLAGLLIVGFVFWVNMKASRQQLMDHLNRELAEVRRQMRTSVRHMERLDDHVLENRERIQKIEVNMMSMQDELEDMSRRLDAFLKSVAGGDAVADGDDNAGQGGAEDGRRHLY